MMSAFSIITLSIPIYHDRLLYFEYSVTHTRHQHDPNDHIYKLHSYRLSSTSHLVFRSVPTQTILKYSVCVDMTTDLHLLLMWSIMIMICVDLKNIFIVPLMLQNDSLRSWFITMAYQKDTNYHIGSYQAPSCINSKRKVDTTQKYKTRP